MNRNTVNEIVGDERQERKTQIDRRSRSCTLTLITCAFRLRFNPLIGQYSKVIARSIRSNSNRDTSGKNATLPCCRTYLLHILFCITEQVFRRSYECFVILSLRLVTNKGPSYVSLRCHDDHVHTFEDPAQECACPSEHGQHDGVGISGRVHSVNDDADDHSDTCIGIAFG